MSSPTSGPRDVPGEPDPPDVLLAFRVVVTLLRDVRPHVKDEELRLRILAVRTVIQRLREHMEAETVQRLREQMEAET